MHKKETQYWKPIATCDIRYDEGVRVREGMILSTITTKIPSNIGGVAMILEKKVDNDK